MKQSTKEAREQQKMLEWLQKNSKHEDVAAVVGKASLETEMDKTLEGTAVIAYWESGKVFHDKKCRTCHQMFATNYRAVDTCSRRCLKAAVEAIGVTWNPEKSDHERWAAVGSPPLIVPPAALTLLKERRENPLVIVERPVEHNPQDSSDALESLLLLLDE